MSSVAPPRPHEPLLVAADWPAVGGSPGPEPEDFVVDELLRFEPSGAGEHLFVRVRKRLSTTPALLRAVAHAAAVRERDVGCAGMKDKHAVTSQWVSLPARCRPPESWRLPPEFVLLEHARHTHKLRTGQHRGNRFSIRLVGVGPDALQRATAILGILQQQGLPNYFGAQRFGEGGSNLAEALSWLQAGAPPRGRQTRFLRKLYPSVIQAEVYNRTLSLRLGCGLDRLLAGDVVRLAGSRALFVVTDAEAERARLLGRDICLTGPMIGPKMKQPAAEAGELEQRAVEQLGLRAQDLALLGRMAHGTRRDLLAWPEQVTVAPDTDSSLRLGFCLGSGSYATQLVRELTQASWLSAR
jgi:tRNA pseudouridine13 synthase